MKAVFIAVLLAALVVMPAMAADNETLNQTYPVPMVLSFSGGHVWGENPVQILDNQTGRIAFIGNTSSRNITLPPDRGYVLRVEPAGLTDAAHNPDSVLIGITEYVGKNPISCVFFTLLFSAVLSAWIRSKRGG